MKRRKLLDYGFNNFEIKPFLNAKQANRFFEKS